MYLTSETQRRMNMAKTKILLMADGGLTPDIYKLNKKCTPDTLSGYIYL